MYPVRNNDAVSEVIGSILLVSLVVIGVAIAAAVLWSQPKAEKIPEFSASISNSSCSVILSHTGGETVMNSTLRLLVDGTDLTNNFIKQGTTGPWSTWGIGETLVYTPSYSCIITPKRVDIVYSSGSTSSSISTGFFENPVSAGVAPRVPGAPMVPDFSGTPTAGFVPFPVQFTGTSTGSPISWSWDFGDGGTSTLQSPSHTYTSAQSYTVSLTVNNGTGTSTLTKTNYITASRPLIAEFTSDTTTGIRPLAVQFTDQSLGSPVSWSWSFGDTGTSTAQSPLYTYMGHGRYTVSLTVTNASAGTNSTTKTNYITVTPSPSWYSCSWGYRKNITIDKSQVSGAQTDFPVLINLASDNDLKTSARTDGYDILFTSSDGTTPLSHEIEKYMSSTGALVAWVKVPTVTDSANTTIFMYYGYPASPNQQNKNGVWGANYKAVWHLTEDPSGAAPQLLDSTANVNHGTSGGAMTTSQQVPAKINGGLVFDGANDNLTTNYIQTGVTAYTIETWLKTSTTSLQQVVVHDRGSDAGTYGTGKSLTLSIGGTYPGAAGAAGDVAYGVDSNAIYGGVYSTTTRVNDNIWHHVVGVWSAPSGTTVIPAQFSIYVDGAPVSTTAVATGSTTSPLTGLLGTQIARHQPWSTHFQGTLDEIRISTAALSPGWIKTEYNNQYSPSTFHYVMGQEQWTC